MSSYEIKIISTQEASNWVFTVVGHSMTTGTLFGGDRIWCCDKAVAILVNNEIVGIATITPNGEESSGIPTIVGVLIAKEHRGKKLGVPLFEAAVTHCLKRGFETIHVDVMSTGMAKTIEKMDPTLRNHLDVTHHNFGGDYVLDYMP